MNLNMITSSNNNNKNRSMDPNYYRGALHATGVILMFVVTLYMFSPDQEIAVAREGSSVATMNIRHSNSLTQQQQHVAPCTLPTAAVATNHYQDYNDSKTNSSNEPVVVVVAASPFYKTTRFTQQQLHLDVPQPTTATTAIVDATVWQDRVKNMVRALDLTLVTQPQVVSFGHDSKNGGASLVAVTSDGGHLAVHVNPRTILVDWIVTTTTSSESTRRDLSKDAKKMAQILAQSTTQEDYTFSIVERGYNQQGQGGGDDDDDDEPDSPMEQMLAVHGKKHALTTTTTTDTKNTLHVWDVEQTYRWTDLPFVDRQMYDENGDLVTSLREQVVFYESLVHPAFMASSLPVKRVLLVGGATGGALREILKYQSVQQVIVLHKDTQLQKAAREHFPQLANCTGFGTSSNNCFDDDRVTVQHPDNVWKWLLEYFGPDICQSKEQNQDKLFDLILFDKLDKKAMRKAGWSVPSSSRSSDSSDDEDDDSLDDDDSSENADDDDYEDYPIEYWRYSRALKCSIGKFGVLSMSVGEAPEPGFALSLADKTNQENLQDVVEEYTERYHLIKGMLDYTWHQRVYDIPLFNSKRLWTVALAMVPWNGKLDDDIELQKGVFDGRSNGGANDFDDRPALINIKLRRNLKEGIKLAYYDGVAQQFFKYPQADWHGVYCLNPHHELVCHLTDTFTTDYEDDILQVQLEPDHNGHSGTVAKVDIPKGTITGLWDAASDVNLPAVQFYRSRHLAEGYETQYNDFAAWVDTYGFDGGLSGLGERVQISINSYHNFLNHACDHNPNMVNIGHYAPWLKEFSGWNPVTIRIAGELDHFKVAARDIKKGELVLDDYSHWDGFLQSKNGLRDFSRLDLWCDGKRLLRYVK